MLVTTKIKIDLQRPSYPVVVNAVQGEQNTRQIELSLYSGCVAWMVPDNVAVAMRYSKPDKTKGYYDTMPDGSASFTVSENRILAFLAPQMLTVPGTVVAQIVLYQGTQTLATFSIHIRVEADPSAGAVTSEDYVNWAQWIKSELDAYLEKLKTNGEFVGGTFVGDVNMKGHALSGLREPVAPDDAVTKEYVDKNAGTGAVSTVAGVAPDETGNVPLDASSVKALAITGGTMEGAINMNGQKLSGLNAPTADDEAATKGFVSSEIKKIDVSSQISGKVDKTSVVNNFTTTEEGFVADARALKTLKDMISENKLSMDLLWQNASPQSTFEKETTLTIASLSEYDAIMIIANFNDSLKQWLPGQTFAFDQTSYNLLVSSAGIQNYYRSFVMTDNGLKFVEGNTDNKNLIPFRVYGIKGVPT